MESTWILAVVMWGVLIGLIIACLIPELKKTPEKRKAEAEMARECWQKKREEEKRKRRETPSNTPTKGCLLTMMEFCFMSVFLLFVVIACIILLVASGS